MSEIGYVVVCEEVYNDKGTMIIKSPLGVINPYQVPGKFSFILAFSLYNIKLGKNNIKIKIEDQNNNSVHEDEIEFDFQPPEEVSKLSESALSTYSLNNLLFNSTGIHEITITSSGGSKKSVHIPVIEEVTRG